MTSMDSLVSRVASSVWPVALWPCLAIHLIAVTVASSPAAETISVNVHKTLTDVSERPVGLCASFINDSDIHHHRDRTMTAVLRQTRMGNYRYPMGALAENYVWHPHGEYDNAAGGLRPRAIAPQAFPLKGALDEEGYFRRAMDYDEFIRCCQRADVDPIICVSSYGWKLPGAQLDRQQLIENASEWVRYANVIHDHGVQYWEIGNEVELHKNEISADEYFAFFRDARRAMKSVDPTIRVGLGLMGNRAYIQQALRQFPDEIDFIVCHQYSNAVKNYAQYKDNAWQYISGIENTIEAIDDFAPTEIAKQLEVLVTEYSAFSPGHAWGNRDNNIVKALLTFEQTGNALYCDDRVRSLNFWVTHSPWGGRGVTSADALDPQNRLTAMGKTLEVMARFLKTKMVEAPRVVGRLRSYASYHPKTKGLSVYVLNKNDRSENVTVALPKYEGPSSGDVYQFTGAAPTATGYTWTERDGITLADGQFQTELPPLSITVFHFVSERD
jgi:alpha-L-arabinofuranosidase